MSKRGDVELLKDILEAIGRVQRYVGTMSLSDFMGNTEKQDAVASVRVEPIRASKEVGERAYKAAQNGEPPFRDISPIVVLEVGDNQERVGNTPVVWMCSAVNGSSATCRARFSASVNMRWCRAHVPVLRRGSILARSEM